MRQILVYEGLLAKFVQNEDLKSQLKSTGDAILADQGFSADADDLSILHIEK